MLRGFSHNHGCSVPLLLFIPQELYNIEDNNFIFSSFFQPPGWCGLNFVLGGQIPGTLQSKLLPVHTAVPPIPPKQSQRNRYREGLLKMRLQLVLSAHLQALHQQEDISSLLANLNPDQLPHQYTHADSITSKTFPGKPVKLGLQHSPGESMRTVLMLDQIHTGLVSKETTVPSL